MFRFLQSSQPPKKRKQLSDFFINLANGNDGTDGTITQPGLNQLFQPYAPFKQQTLPVAGQNQAAIPVQTPSVQPVMPRLPIPTAQPQPVAAVADANQQPDTANGVRRPGPLQLPPHSYDWGTRPPVNLPSRNFKGEARKSLVSGLIGALLGGVLGGGQGAVTGFTAAGQGARGVQEEQFAEAQRQAMMQNQNAQAAYQDTLQRNYHQMEADSRDDQRLVQLHNAEQMAYDRELANKTRQDANDTRADDQELDRLNRQLLDPLVSTESKQGIVATMNAIRKRRYPDLPPVDVSALPMTPNQQRQGEEAQGRREDKQTTDAERKEEKRLGRLQREYSTNMQVAANPNFGKKARLDAIKRNNEIAKYTGIGGQITPDVNDMTPAQQAGLDQRGTYQEQTLALRRAAQRMRQEAQSAKGSKEPMKEYYTVRKNIAQLSKSRPQERIDPITGEVIPLSEDQQGTRDEIDQTIGILKSRGEYLLKSFKKKPDGSPAPSQSSQSSQKLPPISIPSPTISAGSGITGYSGATGAGPLPTATPGAVVHHSATQPRDGGGRFDGPPKAVATAMPRQPKPTTPKPVGTPTPVSKMTTDQLLQEYAREAAKSKR